MYHILLFRRYCLFLAKLEAKRTLLFTIAVLMLQLQDYSTFKTSCVFATHKKFIQFHKRKSRLVCRSTFHIMAGSERKDMHVDRALVCDTAKCWRPLCYGRHFRIWACLCPLFNKVYYDIYIPTAPTSIGSGLRPAVTICSAFCKLL